MLVLTCDGCSTTAFAGCGCPDGYDPVAFGHLSACQMANLGAQVVCPPGSSCCQEEHDHDAAANTCREQNPAGHPAGSCPTPANCKLWKNVRSHHEDPDAAGLPQSCPGGHCGLGVPGCTVCRPITITAPPGHVPPLQRAAG